MQKFHPKNEGVISETIVFECSDYYTPINRDIIVGDSRSIGNPFDYIEQCYILNKE